MQTNFEKDVQQKMDELSLSPSATVWERVELEIRPEKRKRRGIFWLLLAALLLLGGEWWLHQSFENNHRESVEKNSRQNHTKQTAEAPTTITDNQAENKKGNETEKGSSQIKTSPTKNTATFGEKTKPVKISSLVAKRKASFKTQSGAVAVQASVNKKPETTAVDIISKADAAPIENESTKAVATVDSMRLQTIATQLSIDKTDLVKIKEERKEASLPGIDSIAKNNDSVSKKKMASASKWRRQVGFSAGISGYATGPFFQSFNSSRSSYNASALSSPGTPAVTAAQSSPTASGFHFSLDFLMVKSLSKRWEFSIGLQYAYTSTHQKVGDKKTADTTVQFAADKSTASGFYTNTGTADYTAHFHFVELPVSLSFKPSLRLPLYVSMGAAYGKLISTNALTFSSTSNLYYQNKENYLRNAFSISSSVQMNVLSKKKLSLRTGPFAQYNTIKLQKEASSGTPHLITAGIKAAIIF